MPYDFVSGRGARQTRWRVSFLVAASDITLLSRGCWACGMILRDEVSTEVHLSSNATD